MSGLAEEARSRPSTSAIGDTPQSDDARFPQGGIEGLTFRDLLFGDPFDGRNRLALRLPLGRLRQGIAAKKDVRSAEGDFTVSGALHVGFNAFVGSYRLRAARGAVVRPRR
jgi:hypothetical protein